MAALDVSGIPSGLPDTIQRVNNLTLLDRGQSDRGAVSVDNLVLPRLDRIGDRETVTLSVFNRAGRQFELIAEFRRVRANIVQVNILVKGDDRSDMTSFDIHFFNSGAIRGYDTLGTGRINSFSAPVLEDLRRGVSVQLSFDEPRPPPLDFSTIRISNPLLFLLQGVAGSINEPDVSVGQTFQPALPRCPFDLTTAHPDFGIRIITL